MTPEQGATQASGRGRRSCRGGGRWYALIACVSLAGCAGGDDPDDENPSGPQASGAECPPSSFLTYPNFGAPFMEAYCTRCHSSAVTGDDRNDAPEGVDFDTLAGIRRSLERIDEYAAAGPEVTNTTMPPSGDKPTAEDRKRLGEWLACGAE